MADLLYGRNAVRECLRAQRRHFHALILADNVQSAPVVEEIISLADRLNLPVRQAQRKEMDRLARGHQGVALKVGPYPTVDLAKILQQAVKREVPPFILVLDHLEDPHNLGAILRTAEIVGVHGVVIPRQRAAGITPAVVNVSAGAVEHIWVAEETNLVRTLKQLKQSQVWVAGVENDSAATLFHQTNLSGGLALVIGSEGQGLSRLVRETCDFLIKLPMQGQIESLNASVAAALVLYEVWRARDFQMS